MRPGWVLSSTSASFRFFHNRKQAIRYCLIIDPCGRIWLFGFERDFSMTTSSDKAQISRFPVPEILSLPEDLQEMILAVQEKAGFVPNVFLGLAHRPDELRAFFAYHEVLMRRESGLTKAEKEMIVVATSAENDCLYCVVAHGAILRVYAKNPRISDQIATNFRYAEISERQKAMLDFAVAVTNRSSELGEDDFRTLHGHGFTDEDIWDIGAISAFFAMSNRLASMLALRPNDEFYNMGR